MPIGISFHITVPSIHSEKRLFEQVKWMVANRVGHALIFADAVCFESTNTLAKCQRLQDVMYEFISQHVNVVKHFIKT